MKFFIVLCLITTSLFVHSVSISPDKTVTPLLDIFSERNVKLSETTMEVMVSTHNKSGEIFKGSKKVVLPMDKYLEALTQSKAVYEMGPSEADLKNSQNTRTYYGTAFHIGENLVLTNQHVLAPNSKNTTRCNSFQLYQVNLNEVFQCKKVHYCSIEEDVCLIEMAPIKKCQNLFCSKFKLVEMKDREALKLNNNPRIDFSSMFTTVMTAIGNTMGLGIHYSQGKGLEMSTKLIKFHAPIRKGNSGGPLIGEDGLVWGVIKRESAMTVGPDAYNIAASMNVVIDLIRENLTDEEILTKFNNAIEN